nr:unnamed protein product [Callosobruchus chinensis]
MAKANKILNWFLTDSGKQFCLYVAGTFSTGTVFAHFLPHTIFVDKYEEFLHLYSKGLAVGLPDKLIERFRKTLDILKVEEKDQHLYKPFFCYGFDVTSVGSAYSKFGVRVGLPFYFSHESKDEIDKFKIKISDDSIIWDREEAESLLDSMVMSENSQLFAMAKEILYRQSPKPMLDVFFAMASSIGLYGISNHLNIKFNLYEKPRQLRVTMYGFVVLLMYGVYAMGKDVTQMYFEEKIDKTLKQMDPRFAEGGAEYYRKLLQRNIALRCLMGVEGQKRYSVNGNENSFIRTKHLPLVQRLSIFESQ